MESNIISAIIGFWRMGATIEEIKEVTHVPIFYVEQIINRHLEIISCKNILEQLENAETNA